MKKLILFFILLLNITSYSINISIITSSGEPLQEVIVNINQKVKITDPSGKVTFNTQDEILNISISREGFQEDTLILKNSTVDTQNITLIMKPLKIATVFFEFPISNGVIKYREVGAKVYTQLPFLNNVKSIELPFGTYEFIFSSKNYKTESKILNFSDPSKHLFIDLEPNKNQFFFIGNTSKNKDIKFYKENIGKIIPPTDLTLIIFKDSKVIKTVKLKDTFIPIELEDGSYDFTVENKLHRTIFFRGIKISNSSYKNIVISVPSIYSTVKGVIKSNNQFIGGAKILFTDVNNNSYEAISTFVGDFSIDLPPNKYKILLKKPGFTLQKDQDLIYDFTTPHETYNLSLNTEELLSNVEGAITDDQGNAISDANIMIKNGDTIVNLKSDDFGNFETAILPGLLFIKVEKKGYKSFGLVTKLGRFSSLSGLKISLDPSLANISGIVSNSFSPKEGIQLTLRNESGEIIANSISNKSGYYEFADININHKYFISVGTQAYKYYYSEPFLLKKDDITNKNIILDSREIRLYLEFLTSSKKPLGDKEILVDGKLYKTDTNGFLLLKLPENKKSINIKVKSYGYDKNVNLKAMKTNPNNLTIYIK